MFFIRLRKVWALFWFRLTVSKINLSPRSTAIRAGAPSQRSLARVTGLSPKTATLNTGRAISQALSIYVSPGLLYRQSLTEMRALSGVSYEMSQQRTMHPPRNSHARDANLSPWIAFDLHNDAH